METNHDSMVMVQSEFGCDPTIQSEPQQLCDNIYKLLVFNKIKLIYIKLFVFNKIKFFMKLDNECVITKFIFFIDPHNIITYNIANHIIYISNYSTK